MQVVVTSVGSIRCIYAEEIPLTNLGKLAIARGSHVEPTDDGEWHADMAPVNGPILGPFTTRSAALAAGVAWLETHWLTAIPAAA